MTHDAAWFGPNTGQVERFLAAARTLTAEQAADLVAEQRRVLQERPEAHVAAIRAIVAAAFDSGRQDRMKTAEAVGRAAVGAFPELAGRDLVELERRFGRLLSSRRVRRWKPCASNRVQYVR